ncbi:laccase domain protein YfiH [mine drainage metagenome]|uniref:Laccase domain protein YfiH n=1 Tax=mine drainage metagenome TaxID=410659 RepID=A0A1J5R243_9ZZZZ
MTPLADAVLHGAHGARALFTTRRGGLSVAPYDSLNLGDHVGDAPAAVAANRALVLDALREEGLQRIAWLEQVHGSEVVDLDAWDGFAVPRADAAVTSRRGLAACVLVADCLPVLLAAPGAVGAAHAGWRGLAGGVVENCARALCDKAGCTPAEVQAWLGPAIGPRAFEVGDEVREAFVVSDAQASRAFLRLRAGYWLADLFTLARRRLRAFGVSAIHADDICTVSNPHDCYSYRRDRVCGRQAGLVWISTR